MTVNATEIRSEVGKRKRGFPRKNGEVPATVLAQRRHRDRAAKEALAEQALLNATSAAFQAAVPDDSLTDLHEYMASQMQEVSRLLATSGPAVITAMLDKAKQGDTNAAALLLRHLTPAQKTRIKIDAEGKTLSETADSIVQAAASGAMPLEDAQMALSLLEKHGNVSLTSALTDRLTALQTRVMTAASLTGVELPEVLTNVAIESF